MKFAPVALTALAISLATPSFAQDKAGTASAKPTAAEAKEFTEPAAVDFLDQLNRTSKSEWVYSTYITEDTEALNAEQDATLTKMMVGNAVKAARYAQAPGLDYDTNRILSRMRTAITSPKPANNDTADVPP